MAVGRDIRLPDVGCVPVSIIARVPAVTAAMDLASGTGRGGTLLYHNSDTSYHYHYHHPTIPPHFIPCTASMNQHVNCAVEIQIIGCQFDSNKVFLPLAFCRYSP